MSDETVAPSASQTDSPRELPGLPTSPSAFSHGTEVLFPTRERYIDVATRSARRRL